MSIRTPSTSVFRPKGGIDQSVLQENKALVADINRRKILSGAVSLGALSMLTGWRRHQPEQRAGRAARRFGVERPRAGVPVPAEPPCPDLPGIDGGQAAALQCLL